MKSRPVVGRIQSFPVTMLGKRIGPYRITSKLARGGMGVIYLAEDERLERTVVLKFLPQELYRDQESRARFIREAKTASSLDHPNICTIYEIDEDPEGQLFIAMAYYDGESLAERLSRGPLPILEAVDIARQIARALARAHTANVIHRDIKPANIILTNDGVRLLDFGLAKMIRSSSITQSGETLGTPLYMSPEQILGQSVDGRSDIWALGVLLYEMISGKTPFGGDSQPTVIYSVLEGDPPSVSTIRNEVPKLVDNIVKRALQKKVEKRYATAQDMLDDLEATHALLREPSGTMKVAVARDSGRRQTWIALALAAIALVLLVLTLRTKGPSEPVDAALEAPSPPAEHLDSIAVLPLENTSSDPGQDLFSEGVTESLIAALARERQFSKVMSRSSVMRFKNSERPRTEIAKELDVKSFVTGTIRRDGSRIRVHAELVRTSNGEVLWIDDFESNVEDLIGLQQAIVSEVIEVLGGGTPETRLASPQKPSRPINPAAYELTLRGQSLARSWHEDDLRKAIDSFLEAIREDTEYAPAYAGLGNAYASLALFSYAAPTTVAPLARDAIDRAIELKPDSATALASRGRVRMFLDWDLETSEEDFARALEINPHNLEAHLYYATFLTIDGRFGQATEHARRAVDLDLFNPATRNSLQWALFMARRYEESLTEAQRTLQLDPSNTTTLVQIAWNELMLGNHELAKKATNQALDSQASSDKITLSTLAWMLARCEETSRAREILAKLEGRESGAWNDPVQIALIHAALGETDLAFKWLQRGLEERSPSLVFLPQAPWWDPLRDDARFTSLIKQAGFVRDIDQTITGED